MKLSFAMVTAGEPTLEAAVASVRPHVDEVVAVVTRPATLDALDRYHKLFDRFVVDSGFFPIGEDGEVEWERADFAAARNASFALATGDALAWGDTDDVLVGGENLRPTIEKLVGDGAKRFRLLFKYEYAVHEGEVLSEQWRERVVLSGTPYAWEHPVHETLVATDGRTKEFDVQVDTVTWRHLRPADSPRTDRNLRVLLAEEARKGDAAKRDPWLRLNLAQELKLSERFEEALPHFGAYVELSERDDERAFACVALAECFLALGMTDPKRQQEALAWTANARGYRRCFETLYAEAKVRFVRGCGGQEGEVERAAELLEEALALGPTKTPLGTLPADHRKHAPQMLRVAYEMLGDWTGATAAVDMQDRDDPELSMHRRFYQRAIDREGGVAPSVKAGLDIVIVCGPTIAPFDPETAAAEGVGGSETAVIEVSRRLAARGHLVRVIAECPRSAVHDGVWWQPLMFMQDIGAPDVAVAWRSARVLDACDGARIKLVWAHDLNVLELSPERLAGVDRVMGVTAWHLEHLRKLYGFTLQRGFRTRNGIDLSRFDAFQDRQLITTSDGEQGYSYSRIPRNPHKAIYSSSPDRGLAVLLDLWPRIREQVPDATLDVFYGFDNIEKTLKITKDLNLGYMAARMKRLLRELPGVTDHGRVDQKTLARAMMGAGVLAYPTAWMETSCCHPDTRVSVPGDHRGGPPTVRIADLVGKSGFPVYAFNEEENRFQLATCKRVWQTKVADEMVEIALDSGELLRLTPDHKILTFDGDWIQAADAKPGESLRALHYRYNVMIRDGDGDWVGEHRLVGEWKMGRSLTSNDAVDHTADEMRLDNRPESLTVMTMSEHSSKTHRGRKRSKQAFTKQIANFKVWVASEEGKAHVKKMGKQLGETLWARVAAMSEKERNAWLSARAAKKSATIAAKRAADPVAYAAQLHAAVSKGQIEGNRRRRQEDPKRAEELRAIRAKNVKKAHETLLALEAEDPERRARRHQKAGERSIEVCSQKRQDLEWRKREVEQLADARAGRNHKVVSVRRIPGGPVFDMEVEGLHNFVADGVVVHNCITAMEAQAAGMRIVTSDLAALSETVGDRGTLLEGSWLDPEYQDRFVEAVVDAMLVTDDSDRRRSMAYARENFSWDGVAAEWEGLFEQLLVDKRDDGELGEYTPDPEWAAAQVEAERSCP